MYFNFTQKHQARDARNGMRENISLSMHMATVERKTPFNRKKPAGEADSGREVERTGKRGSTRPITTGQGYLPGNVPLLFRKTTNKIVRK